MGRLGDIEEGFRALFIGKLKRAPVRGMNLCAGFRVKSEE
jgi:hypothetical protein